MDVMVRRGRWNRDVPMERGLILIIGTIAVSFWILHPPKDRAPLLSPRRKDRVRALRVVPPRRAGFPLAALLRRVSGASATWGPPENGSQRWRDVVPRSHAALLPPVGRGCRKRRGHVQKGTPEAMLRLDQKLGGRSEFNRIEPSLSCCRRHRLC